MGNLKDSSPPLRLDVDTLREKERELEEDKRVILERMDVIIQKQEPDNEKLEEMKHMCGEYFAKIISRAEDVQRMSLTTIVSDEEEIKSLKAHLADVERHLQQTEQELSHAKMVIRVHESESARLEELERRNEMLIQAANNKENAANEAEWARTQELAEAQSENRKLEKQLQQLQESPMMPRKTMRPGRSATAQAQQASTDEKHESSKDTQATHERLKMEWYRDLQRLSRERANNPVRLSDFAKQWDEDSPLIAYERAPITEMAPVGAVGKAKREIREKDKKIKDLMTKNEHLLSLHENLLTSGISNVEIRNAMVGAYSDLYHSVDSLVREKISLEANLFAKMQEAGGDKASDTKTSAVFDQLEQVKKERDELQNKLSDWRQRNITMTTQLLLRDDEQEKLRDSLDSRQERVQELLYESSELESNYSADLRDREEQRSKGLSKQRDLETRIAKKQDELKASKGVDGAPEALIKEMQEEIDSLNDQLAGCKIRNRELQDEVEHLKRQREMAAQRHESLRSTSSFIDDVKQQVSPRNARLGNLQMELQGLGGSSENLSSSSIALEADLEAHPPGTSEKPASVRRHLSHRSSSLQSSPLSSPFRPITPDNAATPAYERSLAPRSGRSGQDNAAETSLPMTTPQTGTRRTSGLSKSHSAGSFRAPAPGSMPQQMSDVDRSGIRYPTAVSWPESESDLYARRYDEDTSIGDNDANSHLISGSITRFRRPRTISEDEYEDEYEDEDTFSEASSSDMSDSYVRVRRFEVSSGELSLRSVASHIGNFFAFHFESIIQAVQLGYFLVLYTAEAAHYSLMSLRKPDLEPPVYRGWISGRKVATATEDIFIFFLLVLFVANARERMVWEVANGKTRQLMLQSWRRDEPWAVAVTPEWDPAARVMLNVLWLFSVLATPVCTYTVLSD